MTVYFVISTGSTESEMDRIADSFHTVLVVVKSSTTYPILISSSVTTPYLISFRLRSSSIRGSFFYVDIMSPSLTLRGSLLSLPNPPIVHPISLTLIFVLALTSTLSIAVPLIINFLSNFLCASIKKLRVLTLRPFRSALCDISQLFLPHLSLQIHSILPSETF